MDHNLIGSWLQISSGDWPPDHYALLGLNRGEADARRIEQQVFERMEVVRRYQLTHPEPATEAMNRLAQALICLSDPVAKKAYDAALSLPSTSLVVNQAAESPPRAGDSASPPPVSIAEATDPLAWLFGPWNRTNREFPEPSEPPRTLVDWQMEPPPRRLRTEAAVEEPAPSSPETEAISEPNESAPDVLTSPRDTFNQDESVAARDAHSEASRRGLGTKRALYYRIARTRQLLWAWEQTGKYLNPPRRLRRPAEATDLIGHMHAIRQLLQTFPPLLGKAGQPGYLVLTLARQEMIVPMLQALLPSQRDVLARDWQAGHDLLLAHRSFLRQELRALRQRKRWVHGLRLLTTGLFNHPSLMLVLVGLIALNLAIPALRELWLNQVLALAVLFGFRLISWWLSLRPTKIHRPAPPVPARRRARATPAVRRQANSSGA
jgi:hypothetical protein